MSTKASNLPKLQQKKGFKFFSVDRNVGSIFNFTLVLLPTEQGGVFEEGSRKQNLLWSHDTSVCKVIFVWMEKIRIFDTGFTLVDVWKSSF